MASSIPCLAPDESYSLHEQCLISQPSSPACVFVGLAVHLHVQMVRNNLLHDARRQMEPEMSK